jgi:hypothetical protein
MGTWVRWRQVRAAREAALIVIDVWRGVARDHGKWQAADALDLVARGRGQLPYLRRLWRACPRGLERLRQVALDDMTGAGAPPRWME